MKFQRSLFVGLILSLLLSSCGENKHSLFQEEDALPDISIHKENQIDDISLDEDLHTVTFDNPDALNNTYKDVPSDFAVQIEGKGILLTAGSFSGVTLTDSSNEIVDILPTFSGNGPVSVRAKDGLTPGGAYTLSIAENDMLRFTGKDDSVRSIYFTVQKDDVNTMRTKSGFPDYPLKNVAYNTGSLVPDPYLIYEGNFSSHVGDVVTFSDAAMPDDTVYIKIKSVLTSKNTNTIYYSMPEVAEIFEELEFHADDKEADFENHFHLNSEDEIYHSLLESELIQDYALATAYHYNFTNSVVDFLSSAIIDIGFSFVSAGIKLKASILFSHAFESGWKLGLNITFQWIETLSVSADAATRTVLGVPYWVDMNFSAEKDDKFTFSMSIVFTNPLVNPGYDWEDPNKLDFASAKKAVQELKNKYAESGLFDSKHDRTESGVMMVNLGWLDFYFGVVTCQIELFLCLSASVSISLGAGWTYDSHTIIVQFSTSSGNQGGAASPSQVHSSVIDVEAIGKLNIQFFIRLRFSLFITGMKWLARLSCDVDAGLYLNLTGFGGIHYDFVNEEWGFDMGFLLDLGLKLSVSISFVVFDKGVGHWDILDLQKPFFKLGNTDRIQDRMNLTVELSKKETKIDDTALLRFTVLDGLSMSTSNKTIQFDERATYLDSIFIADPLSTRIIENVRSLSTYLDIQGDKILVKEGSPAEFSGEIEITLSNALSFMTLTFIAPFHYLSGEAHYVSFDGANRLAYEKGDVIVFPVPEGRDGYRFKEWLLNDTHVDMTEPFIMGDEDLNFVSRYILDKTYTVRYFDGYNNLVYTEKVRNEDPATGPEPSVRDRYMDGYGFLSWDSDLSCVIRDMDVHGIYASVGEGGR